MPDIGLRATNQDGTNDVRLYSVVSGINPFVPRFVNIYLIPLNTGAPGNKGTMSVVFL
jgi:hypothetical protein